MVSGAFQNARIEGLWQAIHSEYHGILAIGAFWRGVFGSKKLAKKNKPSDGVAHASKASPIRSRKRRPQSQSVRGPGKPTISDDELIEQRDRWAYLLENHWGDAGWSLKCARTVEGIRTALLPLSNGPNPYSLSLLLRPTAEAAIAGAVQETKKKLGLAVQRLDEASERQRKATEAFQKAEWAALEFSNRTRQQFQDEIERRKGNVVRDLKIKMSDKNAEIRRQELLLEKAPQQNRPSLEAKLKSIKSELEKIRMEISAENNTVKQIEDRLRAATPGKRKAVGKVYWERKAEREDANQEVSDMYKERKKLEEMLSDQQAHYCQHQLLKFIRGKRYGHTPRKLANALAGLPDISCRQSASRCAKLSYTWGPNYTVFDFVEEKWRRRDPLQSKAEQILDLFRNALAELPRTVLVQTDESQRKKRVDNYLRRDLSEKWFYLKQAIQEALRAYTNPAQVPYLISARFKENLAKPRTAVDELLADQEKLEV